MAYGPLDYTGLADKAAAEQSELARERRHRGYQEADATRPLSDAERWAAMAAAGVVSVDEAAINARFGAPVPDMGDQANTGMQNTGPAPVPGSAPGGGQGLGVTVGPQYSDNDVPVEPPAPPPPAVTQERAQGPLMAQSRGLAAAPEPKTFRDYNAYMQVAPFLQKGQKSERDVWLELLKERGRNDRNDADNETDKDVAGQGNKTKVEIADKNNEARAAIAGQKLKFQYTKLKQDYEIAMARLRTMLQATRTRAGSNEQIQAMKIEAGRAAANLKAAAQTFMSTAYLAKDQKAMKLAQDAMDEADKIQAQVEETARPYMQGGPVRTPGESSSVSGGGNVGAKPPSADELNSLFGKGK